MEGSPHWGKGSYYTQTAYGPTGGQSSQWPVLLLCLEHTISSSAYYFNPAITLLEIHPSDIYTSAHGKTGAQWFNCRGFRTAVIQKRWEQSKGPPAEDELNESECLYSRDYNAA